MTWQQALLLREEEAMQALADLRWPKGVACPECGGKVETSKSHYQPKNGRPVPLAWLCKECGKRFSLLAGSALGPGRSGYSGMLARVLFLRNLGPGLDYSKIKPLADAIGLHPGAGSCWVETGEAAFRAGDPFLCEGGVCPPEGRPSRSRSKPSKRQVASWLSNQRRTPSHKQARAAFPAADAWQLRHLLEDLTRLPKERLAEMART